MSKVMTLARRELGGLFFSPIGYLVLAIYVGIMGLLFAGFVFVPGASADMRQMFVWSHIALIFVVPLMTMGLLADEYNSGRMEMLRTSPITELDILLGKFFGALGFYAALVGSTLIYVLLLSIYGKPNYGSIITGYVGLLLMGSLFVAIGLFFSACTRYQIVAAMSGFISLVFLGIITDVAARVAAVFLPVSNWFLRSVRDVLQYLSFSTHMEGFAKGVVETKDVAFFLIGTGLFLFISYLVLESRKWR